jgi:hypothetical protein
LSIATGGTTIYLAGYGAFQDEAGEAPTQAMSRGEIFLPMIKEFTVSKVESSEGEGTLKDRQTVFNF